MFGVVRYRAPVKRWLQRWWIRESYLNGLKLLSSLRLHEMNDRPHRQAAGSTKVEMEPVVDHFRPWYPPDAGLSGGVLGRVHRLESLAFLATFLGELLQQRFRFHQVCGVTALRKPSENVTQQTLCFPRPVLLLPQTREAR